MENFLKLLKTLQGLPKIGKILSIVILLLFLVIALFFSACGVTQSVINNVDSPNASHQMEVVPSQSTSTSASPSIVVDLDSLKLR